MRFVYECGGVVAKRLISLKCKRTVRSQRHFSPFQWLDPEPLGLPHKIWAPSSLAGFFRHPLLSLSLLSFLPLKKLGVNFLKLEAFLEDYGRGCKLNPGGCWHQLKSKYTKHWQRLSFPILRGWTFCSRGSSSEERWKDTSRIEVLNVATRTGLLGPEPAPRPRPAHSLAEFRARLLPCVCLPHCTPSLRVITWRRLPARPVEAQGDLGALLFSCQAPGHVGRG